MAAVSDHSPFLSSQFDWGHLNSWLLAITITATTHGLLNLSPTPPLQQQGGEEWKVISTVQLIQTRDQPPTDKTEEKAVEKPTVEKKPQPKPKQKKPELIVSKTPKPTMPQVEKTEIKSEIPKRNIAEIIEDQPKKTLDKTESKLQEVAIQTTQPPLDTTNIINNLTASLVNQRVGVPLAEYRSQIIDLINANKSYPNTARRRGIQGDVEVSFTVANDGSVIDLKCLGDAKILNRSACEAIKKSLPFPAPEKKTLQLSFVMDYVLK